MDELLQEVKDYLDITWNDEATDRKLNKSILAAKAYLQSRIGKVSDWNANDDFSQNALELLKIYAMYDRAGAIHDFKENYADEILHLQCIREVDQFAAVSEQGNRDV